jgi:large subunit ribosomal protein L24
MKVKKGDKVVVITGKFRGKSGVVEQVLLASGKVRVAGINTVKRNVSRNTKLGRQGGQIEVHRPLDVSNVKILSPHNDKAVRVGYQGTGKDKVRVDKKTGDTI